ncbi:malto-oligosyltrehalose trehalohydrolase [Sphingobacterium sp. LRF_L2]|uniref:malto-oligosyltrehalose trehalohydrolase n=1 Tax=Sphingobacterium sp. LRF_L2 TaxID=3369421 RepID=UPI003F62E2FC
MQPLGITLQESHALIHVWAPGAKEVTCLLEDTGLSIPLLPQPLGYWSAESDKLYVGQHYYFVIDGKKYPDPASRSQPLGVHGPSAIVDIDFNWQDQNYSPPAFNELIIYELHVGTFTSTGTFHAITEKIPYLKELGINAIEIMPIAQFPGNRNWGYDGVFSFAVQHAYGGAKELQKLVNACHQEGIAVFLDVVYNHFGPEGNYLEYFAPYFTEKYRTPWGKAINYDDAWSYGVRHFMVSNALSWFKDFHIDGLRMDAVHAMKDFSPVHVLQEIRKETDKYIAQDGKSRYLIAECDLNDTRFLEPLKKNGFALDAQWVDEFHHALRVAVGEERKGYYSEFNGVEHLAKAYNDAYVFDGGYSEHRKNFFGSKTAGFSGNRFIVFSQNHDQVGNRMLGERSGTLYGANTQRLMALAVFLSPYIPMLFMGEEWNASTPFQYFVSHSDIELIAAVREGRKKEFRDFHQNENTPDPQEISTFTRSVLNWNELKKKNHISMFLYYKALLDLRKTNKLLNNIERNHVAVEHDIARELIVLTIENDQSQLKCFMNFSTEVQWVDFRCTADWALLLDTEELAWGGHKTNEWNSEQIHLAPRSGIVFSNHMTS